ncbi:MAG TPA: IS4 family transposase [Verrucomicrobiae bacterium]|nr:IS4 family transposase [Verrucomicrobiae bacterium]
MHTPYFPAFRARLASLGRRTTQRLRQATLTQLQEHLRDFLPAPLLSAAEDGPNSRERLFSLRLTFECFVWQLLKPQTSCREVVRQVQTLLRLQGLAPIDEGDSAYIQARQRLPRERLEKALSAIAQAAERRAGSGGQLHRRPVKVVDGSTTQLPDTTPNQRRYPQPTGQKSGCGFPMMRFVALLSLKSGVILKVMMDSLRSHDLRLFRRLWDYLQIGDIVLGDRAFGEYSTLAQLPQRGVDVVARLHQKRRVDFRNAQRLAKGDGLFLWTKGCQQSNLSTARQWQGMPAQITVRIIRFTATLRGFRNRRVTLVTTLLDPQLYPAREIIALYARRWSLEICFRDLKTTMGMETLRCQSPEMAEKELLAYLVAHNLVRCVMAEAVARYPVDLQRISFKGTVDAIRQYSTAIAQAPNRKLRRVLWEDLLLNLVRDLVPLRPNRREPRAVKHRPKAYPLLNQPRRKFVEISHRSRYWKGRPRKYRALN